MGGGACLFSSVVVGLCTGVIGVRIRIVWRGLWRIFFFLDNASIFIDTNRSFVSSRNKHCFEHLTFKQLTSTSSDTLLIQVDYTLGHYLNNTSWLHHLCELRKRGYYSIYASLKRDLKTF